MTVAQLMEILTLEVRGKPHLATGLVVLSSDAEGNRYRPLHLVGTAQYAQSMHHGEIVVKGDEDHKRDNAVVLWPAD